MGRYKILKLYIANVRLGKLKITLISGHDSEFVSYHLKNEDHCLKFWWNLTFQKTSPEFLM